MVLEESVKAGLSQSIGWLPVVQPRMLSDHSAHVILRPGGLNVDLLGLMDYHGVCAAKKHIA